MSEAIPIREAVAADVLAILRIAAVSPAAPQWKNSEYEGMFPQRRSHETGKPPLFRAVFVADDCGTVCGYAIVSVLEVVYPSEAELEALAVDPAYRRRGLGRRLVQATARFARSRGADALRLEVRASNTEAAHLYSTQGFTRSGIRPGYYATPTEDAICMEATIL